MTNKTHVVRRFVAKHAEFVRGAAILMSGKTLAAAIAFFTMPIVARLFVPSDFGVAAMFVSIVSIVSSVGSLRYGEAVVLPKAHSEAVSLMAFAYRVVFSTCTAMMLLIVIYEASGETWPALELLGKWKWFLPFGVLFQSMIFVQASWLIRNKAFKTLSAADVVGNTVTTGTRIGLGAAFGSSAFGLVVGYLVGLISRIAVQRSGCIEGLRATFRRIGWPKLRQIASRYSDFPKLNAPAGLLFSMGGNLPVLLFGVMFSPAIAGFYAMADRLSQVPLSIVANSARQVFLQKSATISQSGRSLQKAFLLATGALALFGIIPFICVWLYGQQIITWLLGERWSEAGLYIEIIAPWLFVLLVAAPCHPVLVVLREQKYWLSLEIAMISLRLGAFGIAYFMVEGPIWTLQAFTLVSVIGNLATILTAFMLISRRSINDANGDSGTVP